HLMAGVGGGGLQIMFQGRIVLIVQLSADAGGEMRQRFDAMLHRLVAALVGTFSRLFVSETPPGFGRLFFRERPCGATGQHRGQENDGGGAPMSIMIHAGSRSTKAQSRRSGTDANTLL